jgi:hypothetical protein
MTSELGAALLGAAAPSAFDGATGSPGGFCDGIAEGTAGSISAGVLGISPRGLASPQPLATTSPKPASKERDMVATYHVSADSSGVPC